jgi:hypothetical protein
MRKYWRMVSGEEHRVGDFVLVITHWEPVVANDLLEIPWSAYLALKRETKR